MIIIRWYDLFNWYLKSITWFDQACWLYLINGIELWINLWYHTFKLKLQTQKQLTKHIKKSLEEIKYSSLDNTVQTKSSSTQIWTILMYSSLYLQVIMQLKLRAQILEFEQNYISITMIMFHCYYGQSLYGVQYRFCDLLHNNANSYK